MASGSTPGNGSKSPFGNGNGNTGEGRAAVGSVGTGAPSSTAGKAPPFNPNDQKRAQPAYNDKDIAATEPPGGRMPFANVSANVANPIRRTELGVGTIGDGRKPFTLTGG
jgi:hypothetical protein